MKIDTVIDIARCKKTPVHTRLARVLMTYKKIYDEETIEEMYVPPDWITIKRDDGEYGCYRKFDRVPNSGRRTYNAFREILSDLSVWPYDAS